MSMSFNRRKRACLHLIEHGFDTDQTVAWMRKEYADDETIQRAGDPIKLCRNIITMRGSGRERDLNLAAFEAAIGEVRERERKTMRDQLDAARVKESELRNRIDSLQDEILTLERDNANHRILQLQEAPTPAA